jgi:DNA-binding NarL/FixJ family response regulator
VVAVDYRLLMSTAHYAADTLPGYWPSGPIPPEEVALRLVSAPLTETLPRLSAALAPIIAHRALAELSPACPYSPFQTYGDLPTGAATLTSRDVAALQPRVAATGTYQGRADAFGADARVVVMASGQTDPAALLVIVCADSAPVPAYAIATASTLWNLLTAHRVGMQADLDPAALNVSRAVAAARASTLAELGDAHAAALAAILGVLRDRALRPADTVARATDLALTALADLRERGELDQAFSDQRAGEAFDRLATSLRRSLRPRGVRLDLRRPSADDGADRMLPHDVAAAAAATLRAVAHTMLESPDESAASAVTRIHLSWTITDADLHATIRDNGAGVMPRRSLDARHILERLTPLGGRLHVEAIPDWGTTITIVLPLSTHAERVSLLSHLTSRELDVLTRIAHGQRNRHIALDLNLSESTIKFHVARIFDKLGVASRGEAAALAHRAGAA